MSTFTRINEATLVETVQRCRARLVYIAPGLTEAIAVALGEVLSRSPTPAVTVIVDIDPEVCRLGYGTVEGLQALQRLVDTHHIGIRYQAGLRVGVLICDDDLLVYAPTPLLIETGSDRDDQPNAIVLGQRPLDQVLQACAAEGPSQSDMPLPSEAEIGSLPATPAMLAESLEDLKRLPPKPYDVSRAERVFNSKLQYVDFEVTGYRLSSRRVPIPNDLLVGEDETLEKRLRNTFTLLGGKSALQVEIADHDPRTNEVVKLADGKSRMIQYSEQRLEEERKKIYDDFLTNIPGYGWLIMRARRTAFDQRVAWFKTRVELFKAVVEEKLSASVEASVGELAKVLLPALRERMPNRLLKFITVTNPQDDDFLRVLEADLRRAFGTRDGFFDPQIKVLYKDLTYETIKEARFRELLDAALRNGGGEDAITKLFQEYDAAPESARPA